MKRALLIFITVFTAWPQKSNSQELTQTIKGQVFDVESHIALPGATIIILDTDPLIGTISDQDGYFKIENLSIGRYNLQINFIGYEPYIIKELLIGSGKEVVLNIGLKESILKLGEVKITAHTNKEDPLNSMATISARQLSVEESRRYAAGYDDPARLVSSFAGVTTGMQQNGIVIRGNAPKGILWRLEGIEISNPNHFANQQTFGAGGLTALSNQMLSNSDFFTSAFPAEYGNALSGVFDLKMRKGNNEKREHTIQIGAIGIDIASEGPFTKSGKSSYLFNYRLSTFTLIAPLLPEEAKGIIYQDLAFKLNFPSGKLGNFSLWGLGANDIQKFENDKDTLNIDTDDDYNESYHSKLYMGAVGITNKLITGKKTYIHTTISLSGNSALWKNETEITNGNFSINEKAENETWKYSLSVLLNHKFNTRITNRTGFVINNLRYRIYLSEADSVTSLPFVFVNSKGNRYLTQFFTQTKINISKTVTTNIGIHSQYFNLNNRYTIEPRLGISWNFAKNHSLHFGFGQHSQIEMLHFYLAQQKIGNETVFPNKKLDFSKAYHLVFGWNFKINNNLRLTIEPYYQKLYDIPVIPNSYFSLINIDAEWFLNDSLINAGKGTNIGIDLTFERFLNDGYYYLITASIFDSKYQADEKPEVIRNTKFNRNYIINLLAGKEWEVGKAKNNMISINGKLTFIGGERVIPYNKILSVNEVIKDYDNAYEEQLKGSQILSFSFNYRKNKKKYASIFSVQMLNALGAKEFEGFEFDETTGKIVKKEQTMFIPFISYKIEF